MYKIFVFIKKNAEIDFTVIEVERSYGTTDLNCSVQMNDFILIKTQVP